MRKRYIRSVAPGYSNTFFFSFAPGRRVVHFNSCTFSTVNGASLVACISSERGSTLLYSVSPERSQTTHLPGVRSRGHPSHQHSYYNQPLKVLSQQFLRKGHVRIYPLFVFWQKCEVSINAEVEQVTLAGCTFSCRGTHFNHETSCS